PLAGQYGVAPGKIRVETRALPQFGRPEILITDLCRRRKQTREPHEEYDSNANIDVLTEYF
ncbi:unnamed protein product, partial [Rotaria socialis]